MADEDSAAAPKGHTPPYIAFQTLKTVLASFKASGGAPGRLDRSVLDNFSGAVGGQIITSLKFLKLIDDSGHPLPSFNSLIDAYGTDQWHLVLSNLLHEAYQPIFTLNLETASPGQFTERFRVAFPAKEETLRKCVTFFLNAAREADIRISPFIMKNKKPRSAPTKQRATRPGRKANGGATKPEEATPPPDQPKGPGEPSKPTEYDLLALLEPKMTKDQVDAVWTLIRYIKRMDVQDS